tara:strand:- start:107 stop:367 length:261 start_codon:yes stop_codon:yes gene_type:complete
MPRLKLNTFRRIYKSLKTPWTPINWLILGYLIGLEEQYINFKTERTVDKAIADYNANTSTKVTKPEIVTKKTSDGWEMSIGQVDEK